MHSNTVSRNWKILATTHFSPFSFDATGNLKKKCSLLASMENNGVVNMLK